MLKAKQQAELIAHYEGLREELRELEERAELIDRELARLETLLPDSYPDYEEKQQRVRPK